MFPVILSAVVGGCVIAEDRTNYSELRERWNATSSPYLDIRRTVLGINPGASIPNGGIEMTARVYSIPQLYDEDNRIVQGTEERQTSVAAQLRQTQLLGPVGWEMRGGFTATQTQTSQSGDLTDPFLGLNGTIYNERRWGVSLYGGVGLPVPAESNWIENHGGVSYRGELRGSFSDENFALTFNTGATYTPNGENRDAYGIVVPTTPPTVENYWATTFTGLDFRLLCSVRLTQYFRFGVLQELYSYSWDGTASYTTLDSDLTTAPSSLFIEISLPYGWHASAAIGKDFQTDNSGVRGEFAIVKTFY